MAFCSRRLTLTDSRQKVSMSPLTGRRNLSPLPKEDKHRSPHIREHAPSSSHKEEESCRTSSRNSGASSPQAPDSTNSKKSSCQGKRSPLAKEQPDSCDTKEHHTSSSRHKDRPCSAKAADVALTRRAATPPQACSVSTTTPLLYGTPMEGTSCR